MKNKQLFQLLAFSFIVFFILLIFSFRPLPPAKPSNCAPVEGCITLVKKGGGQKDIVLELEKDKSRYYINRGLEKGLSLQDLQNDIGRQKVKLYYIRHWSLFNLNSRTRHIARIEVDGKVIYNEWRS